MDNPFGDDRDRFGEFLVLHTPRGHLILRLILTGAFGFLISGFLYGAMFRPPYSGINDRLMWGVMWGILSLITFGNPPLDEGGVKHTTVWPLIFGCWCALFFWMELRGVRAVQATWTTKDVTPRAREDTRETIRTFAFCVCPYRRLQHCCRVRRSCAGAPEQHLRPNRRTCEAGPARL
jgi:hypothetical protein